MSRARVVVVRLRDLTYTVAVDHGDIIAGTRVYAEAPTRYSTAEQAIAYAASVRAERRSK